MTITIAPWLLWMLAGSAVGRAAEALLKFLAYLDRETRGPSALREVIHRPPPPPPLAKENPIPMPKPGTIA